MTLSSLLTDRIADAKDRAEKLHYLTDILVSDGYIVRDGADRFVFRSSLLGEFWKRRVASV